MKRCIIIFWTVLFLLGMNHFGSYLGLGLRGDTLFAQQQSQKQEILTDENTTPSQFHKMIGEMKSQRLNQLRKLGKRILAEGTLAQSEYDAKYYKLDLNLNDTTQIISGSVYMYAQALVNSFVNLELNFFDNPQMYIDSIKTNYSSLTFSWYSDIIHITLDHPYNQEPFDVTVYYHGHPLEGGLQSFDWSSHGSPSVPVISTLSEPYFAQAWWPCKDMPIDKADSADINITVRSDLIVASNGLLREVIDHGTTKTYKWHEKYPITTYLIMIATTNYTIFSNWYHPIAGPDSMEVRYYVYPEYLSQAQSLYPVTPSMIQFYANTFGEYPFVEEKYGMAHFTWGGAMEHQTCTSILYSWYSEYVIAHELSHQWWGDYITCQNWHHIWLNEGFASYCEALWYEHLSGIGYYHTYMGYMKFTSGGTIYIQDTTNVNIIFGNIVYDKGAWVLHMLRHVAGDSTFFDILRSYYSDPRYAHGSALTEDFQGICEDVSGMDLDYFFQEWIYGTYYPKYRYSWIYESAGSGYYDVYLHIDQTQTTPPTHFTMPVDVTLNAGGSDTTFVVFNDPRHKDFQLRVYGAPSNLRLDKDEWILRTTTSTSYTFNIVTTDLPSGTQFVPYQDTLVAKGGTPPYKWILQSGNLPDGLTLDSLTGIIAGTASVLDSFDFTVKATDSSSPQKMDNQQLYIKIETGGFSRGDVNRDGHIDSADVVYLINYLFLGGPSPIPLEAGDANCDGKINAADVVYLINYLFIGGPAPGC
jgi:aminopeptidase N